MKKINKLYIVILVIIIVICIIYITNINNDNLDEDVNKNELSKEEVKIEYTEISQEKAKEYMDNNIGIILDVREDYEYNEGHIKDAILLPLGDIEGKANEVMPNKDEVILVYCRSGNRSKVASEKLVDLGYTNVYEFGGIITWEYEIEK